MHSFDRYYVVTKFMLPTIGDLMFSKLDFNDTCLYTDNKSAQNTESRKYMLVSELFSLNRTNKLLEDIANS